MTVQCKGRTNAGERCTRMTKSKNGYCCEAHRLSGEEKHESKATVADLSADSPLAVLREFIDDNELDVSKATGGHNCRTCADIFEDIKAAMPPSGGTELTELALAHREHSEETSAHACSFFFVHRKTILSSQEKTLPRFQELEQAGKLVKRLLTREEAFSGDLADTHLAVSHRWFQANEPDEDGEQLRAVQEYLKENLSVEWVWYDFWCMPQEPRTEVEDARFRHMLGNINLLYLGFKVLLLLDMSYIGRFWTQFEAWLSFQQATTKGLQPASEDARRVDIVPIKNGLDFKEGLVRFWKTKTPDEAFAKLSDKDVSVTNESDKRNQLPKIKNLDKEVKEALKTRALSNVLAKLDLKA